MPVATALSVIVPTYNCEAWADECLDSVLRQLPENAELIVVDDGSQDATPRLLAAYENTRKNLRIVYRPHLGASSARNAGLEAARGEFVAFLDCDDCLQDGFLAKKLPLPEQEADLTIFGIERVPLTGERELWTVNDRFYPSVHDFADDYIRKRNLLIYSNCNKLYRRRVIEQLSLRFEEDVSFGEDRLFNYGFLRGCGGVITCRALMLRYIQRSEESLSSRSVPGYFDGALRLHRAKTECFLSLSAGTTAEERQAFVFRDLAGELRIAIKRFQKHPGELAENLPSVNAAL